MRLSNKTSTALNSISCAIVMVFLGVALSTNSWAMEEKDEPQEHLRVSRIMDTKKMPLKGQQKFAQRARIGSPVYLASGLGELTIQMLEFPSIERKARNQKGFVHSQQVDCHKSLPVRPSPSFFGKPYISLRYENFMLWRKGFEALLQHLEQENKAREETMKALWGKQPKKQKNAYPPARCNTREGNQGRKGFRPSHPRW